MNDNTIKAFLVLSVVSTYLILVLTNRPLESGFVAIAVYIIKKYLDEKDTSGGNKNGKV